LGNLLRKLQTGHDEVVGELIPLVYCGLRRLAGSFIRRENSPSTVQTAALIQEPYLRLVDQRNINWQNCASKQT
jgi:hypothetical protein